MNFLYVIEELPSGESNERIVKIGVSKNVKSRLQGLQTGNSSELRVIEEFPIDDSIRTREEQEAKIHECFGSKRGRGEWFHFEKEFFEIEVLSLLRRLFPPFEETLEDQNETKRIVITSDTWSKLESEIQNSEYVDLKLIQIQLERLLFRSEGEDKETIKKLLKRISLKIREGYLESREKDQSKLKIKEAKSESRKQRRILESIAFGVLVGMKDH